MKRIAMAILWVVVFLLVVIVAFFTLVLWVEEGKGIYGMAMRMVPWVIVTSTASYLSLCRSCDYLRFDKSSLTQIEKDLYLNLLHQPSELEALDHKTRKGDR